MKKEITLFNYKFELLPLIAVLTVFSSFILLGNWQMRRLKTKNSFINNIEKNIENPAISIHQTNGNPELYSKIAIYGSFLTGKDVFLYGRRSAAPEKDGYYMLSVFEANNGKKYLVSRGWMPQRVKDNYQPPKTKFSESIEAMVMPGEKKSTLIPENDRKNNVWFTLDLGMAEADLGITESNFYLMQIASNSLPEGALPLRTTFLSKVRNDHLEYAITWYSLGSFLLIIYLVYNYKRQR